MKTNVKIIILAIIVGLSILGVVGRELTKIEEIPTVPDDSNIWVTDVKQGDSTKTTQNFNDHVIQPSGQETTEDPANVARDGNIAIQEEFDVAKKLNTREALRLFIDRHPDHELSIQANLLLEKL